LGIVESAIFTWKSEKQVLRKQFRSLKSPSKQLAMATSLLEKKNKQYYLENRVF
jgi:hypothetical protein